MKVLITGGAGFIGSNTADSYLQAGHEVVLLDNLSRPGCEKNLAWLRGNHGDIGLIRCDVRDAQGIQVALRQHRDVDAIFHFAGQVAVTTSVVNPRHDFEVNALGTLNVLEAVRGLETFPVVVFASTNKVYGAFEHLQVNERETRYAFTAGDGGVSELEPLDFYSPYGCSKGMADQYVRDYHRTYGLRSVVFRMSCIYGPHQFGIEDQGWLAWFLIAAVQGRPITIYGDGKQVRDALYIENLTRAFLLAVECIGTTNGQIYNIGGGAANSISIWKEFGPLVEELVGHSVKVSYADWRVGDQRIYISDVSKAKRDFGWRPEVSIKDGVQRLHAWIVENPDLFR